MVQTQMSILDDLISILNFDAPVKDMRDVNFHRTFQMVQEKKYLERILEALPENSIPIKEIYERAMAFLNLKAIETKTKTAKRI